MRYFPQQYPLELGLLLLLREIIAMVLVVAASIASSGSLGLDQARTTWRLLCTSLGSLL